MTNGEKQIDDGDLAFPFAYQWPTTGPEVYYGMSLRDWFAGQALCGELVNPAEGGWGVHMAGVLAKKCYTFADAMIAERNKQ